MRPEQVNIHILNFFKKSSNLLVLRHGVRSTALFIQFSLRLTFPPSSPVRWPYLSRISYQAQWGKCWHRLPVSYDWGEVGSLLSDVLPPAFILSQAVIPHMMFFLNPSFCFAVSVFCCLFPLGSRLQPWSVPAVHVSTLRAGAWGPTWLFPRSHEWFRALQGGGSGGNTSQRQPGRHRGIITTAWALIHQGAFEKAVSANIHILSNSSQILLVLLISYFTAKPQ